MKEEVTEYKCDECMMKVIESDLIPAVVQIARKSPPPNWPIIIGPETEVHFCDTECFGTYIDNLLDITTIGEVRITRQ